MASEGGIVFDLFHTLVDAEPLIPEGFDALTSVAETCGLDLESLAAFWSATYVERETTLVRLVDLVDRFARQEGQPLGVDQRAAVDAVFGVGKDDALRSPDARMVSLVAELARRLTIGVLSNCHQREVRYWEESPLASHVNAVGRSCEIGVMKPQQQAYEWVLARLGVSAIQATYVGNGSSEELVGARQAGFGFVVHCNIFDRLNGLVSPREQRRRAAQADVSVDTVEALAAVLSSSKRP